MRGKGKDKEISQTASNSTVLVKPTWILQQFQFCTQLFLKLKI